EAAPEASGAECACNLVDDRVGILAARIFIGDDGVVGVFRNGARDPAPAPNVALPGGAEHDDDLPARAPAQRREDVARRLLRRRDIDDDPERLAFIDEL